MQRLINFLINVFPARDDIPAEEAQHAPPNLSLETLLDAIPFSEQHLPQQFLDPATKKMVDSPALRHFIKSLTKATRYLAEKSPEHRLAEIHFDETKIPAQYVDARSYQLMHFPYRNTNVIDDTHPEFLDENTVNNLFGSQHHYIPDALLRIKLAKFIKHTITEHHHLANMKQAMVILDEKQAKLATEITRRNLLLKDIKDIPENLVDPISHEIFSFPVTISEKTKVDLKTGYKIEWDELKEWWDTCPGEFRHPEWHGKVMSIQFAQTIYDQVGQFAKLLQEIASIKQFINSYGQQQSHHKTLQSINFAQKNIPKHLIFGLSGQILTHPVLLDGKYLVDFEVYMSWCEDKNFPENRYQNFFTNEQIQSMTYDYQLKTQLDEFVQNAITPPNHGLIKNYAAATTKAIIENYSTGTSFSSSFKLKGWGSLWWRADKESDIAEAVAVATLCSLKGP